MDHLNFDDIQALYQTAQTEFGTQPLRAKVALMLQHDAQYPQQALPDPYYGGFDGFERVLDQCELSSQAWVSIFKQQFETVIKVRACKSKHKNSLNLLIR